MIVINGNDQLVYTILLIDCDEDEYCIENREFYTMMMRMASLGVKVYILQHVEERVTSSFSFSQNF
jgi:hypothetical protein